MDETNNSSFIETAMKHHSTTQAAIKSLQHQLECFDHIRKSTKEIFLLTEKNEKAVEHSAENLLNSTSRYLCDTPDNKVHGSPLLTSTLSKKNTDDTVIRNLLPTFEDVQPLTALDIQPPILFSPIKPINQSILTSATRDSFASTTLPPTPSSDVIKDSVPRFNDIEDKNSVSPGSKNCSVVAPSSGCMSLSEVLARLAYSSALNGTGSGQDSFGSSSDELIGLLEKISRTGEQLKIELQEARLRETALLKEIQRLKSQQNGYHVKSNASSPTEHTSPHIEVWKLKCEKLEDALLSLQDENIKLNRQVKSGFVSDSQQVEPHLDQALKQSEEENFFLKKQLERIRDQLRLAEEMNKESRSPPRNFAEHEKGKHALMEEQKRCKEAEDEIKSLTQRLNDLEKLLVEKEEKIFKMEEKLCEAKDASRLSLSRCEDLENNDVYKRKEVLQLCDKFEKMKKLSKKMENDLLEYKKKERNDVTGKWAVENSLQKVAQENKFLRSKMKTELQKITMDKLLVEKDYDILKKRYNALLDRVGRNDAVVPNDERNIPQRLDNQSNGTRATSSDRILTPIRHQYDTAPRAHTSAGDHGPLTSTRRHRRRHTTPRLISRDVSRESSDAKTSPSDETDNNSKLFSRTTPEKHVPRRVSQERRSFSATPTRGDVVSRVTSLDRARDLCNRLSSSLSPLDVRHLAKSAYTEEYMKNMDGINKLLSVSDRSVNKTTETVDNSPLPPTSQFSAGRNHRRTKTAPGIAPYRSNGDRPKSLPALAYGESPYSEEYMRNMDGVRLVVNLSSNSGEAPTRVGSSPGKSILKKSGSSEAVTIDASDVRRDDSRFLSPAKSTTILSSTYARSSPEKLKFSEMSNQKRSSCASERSLHLSDLPCEQGDVYEKFRNFDSHISTLPMPQTVQATSKPDKPSDNSPAVVRSKLVQPSCRARERSLPSENNRQQQKPVRKEDDNESTEHSSISTVRDHAGRVEFLRELQTNTGVRMPALMRDVTINRDVIVDDVDLDDEEVHMGLSNNQQAYADKLVRKYTRKVKRP
uniref:Vacuolar protein sorting-associated protein 35-like n=1 Tax=Phallusia mammillata TaxID=59560 RepID=A0A6F9DW03_9ASCI|nr:vacuolar protein sorting-associated protein 35-like [Phallusia mammillata]